MSDLIALLVAWLAAGFGLPADAPPPGVAQVPPETMLERRIEAAGAGAAGAAADSLHAVYDDRSRTILLPERWDAGSPAETSILVHELVHHLQNAAGLAYPCAAARERLAYEAQERWLGLFGLTLADSFGIDRMTLRLRTRCMH